MSVTLDTSFGTNGKVIGNLAYDYHEIQSIKLYNNKIIVAGSYELINDYVFLARYNLDGTIDTTFGVNGFVLTIYKANTTNVADIMIIQSDGSIIILCEKSNNFYLVKYDLSGTFISETNVGYTFNPNLSCFIYKNRTTDAFAICFVADTGNYLRWYIQQYNSNLNINGSLIETNFIFDDSSQPYNFCFCFTIDYSGNLILGGRTNAGDGYSVPNIFKYEIYNSSGVYINTITYTTTSNAGEGFTAIDIDTLNNVIVIGDNASYILIQKYSSNGTLLYNNNNSIYSDRQQYSVKVDMNNKIIIGYHNYINNSQSFYITRLNQDLTIDSTFNSTSVEIPDYSQYILRLAIQTDGKILSAGYLENDESGVSIFDYEIYRYRFYKF